MLFKGSYLRVSSPITSNGTNIKLDETGRAMYRETFLPLSARKELENQNKKLPEHLRKKIEVVHDSLDPNGIEEKQRAKPGPKPKTQAA